MAERGSSGSILVVDDEPLQLEALSRFLQRNGFDVGAANDGLGALELLESRRFDVVITDLNMPHLDGLELLEMIKLKDPEAAVIVLSGVASVGTAVLAMKLGATNLLEKPFDNQQLLENVQSALRGSAPTEPPEPETDSPPPNTIGRYEVRDVIGRGGMGTVFSCWDPQLDRTVAVKTLERRLVRELGDDEEQFMERFRREAKAAAKLNHPNVVAVYDFGFDDNLRTLFLAMELVVGRSVRELLRADGNLPVTRAVKLAFQVADGLALAHRQGIIHRDVKPLNVIVTESGDAKLVDFGIAHVDDSSLTDPGVIFGSVSYTCPEIITGDPVDARSDQFSLGTVLFEMLTGVRLFEGKNVAETMRGVVQSPAPSLEKLGVNAPVWLQGVLDRMLHKSADGRYQDDADLLADLAHVGDELGLTLIALSSR